MQTNPHTKSGARLNKKMSSYKYRNSHYTDKTVSWPSYHYKGNPHTRKDSLILRRGPVLRKSSSCHGVMLPKPPRYACIRTASNDRHGASNCWLIACLFNSLFRLTTKKHKRPALLSLCEGNPLLTSRSLHKGTVSREMFSLNDAIMGGITGINDPSSVDGFDSSLQLRGGMVFAHRFL